MTDPALLFCTTLIMVAFWRALHHQSRLWGYLFFVGCGFGLLAKGPVALALTGVPIFLWIVIQKQWRPLWQCLPWVSGCLLALAIALPWYLLAEQRTPGFLQYFIMGENIGRFLDPGWKGDQYGFAHAYPRGMIWLFALAGLFPWSIVALGRLRSLRRGADGWTLYLGLWVMIPLLFFTFSANIIWPYCLTMMPGFALLLAGMDERTSRFFAGFAGVVGILAMIAFVAYPEKTGNHQKDVVAAWQAEKPDAGSALLFWGARMEFSAAFYSGGRAKSTNDPALANALLHNETQDYIVVNDSSLKRLPPEIPQAFKEIARFKNGRGVRILLQESFREGKTNHDDRY